MTFKQAYELYFDSARYWLHNVKQIDTQTIEDVLASLECLDVRDVINTTKQYGREEVFTTAILQARCALADLESKRNLTKVRP